MSGDADHPHVRAHELPSRLDLRRTPAAPATEDPGAASTQDRPPAPYPRAAPAATWPILDDLRRVLAGYDRLDRAPRHPLERLAHLTLLLAHTRRHVERGVPPRGLLIAVAAQAVHWASTLDD